MVTVEFEWILRAPWQNRWELRVNYGKMAGLAAVVYEERGSYHITELANFSIFSGHSYATLQEAQDEAEKRLFG